MSWWAKRAIRWLPAVATMTLIFTFSSMPAAVLPEWEGWLNLVIKKGAHLFVYGVLAVAYWLGLAGRPQGWRYAWAMAVLYAITDESHQSFVPGRGATVVDVGIDALGAALGLWLWSRLRARPDRTDGTPGDGRGS